MASSESGGAPKRRRFDAVWLLPLLAAIAVAYMIYHEQASKGPVVSIEFDNAVGIVDGKTPVRYKGVQIGTVRSVEADPDNGRVILECQLDSTSGAFALEGARFWIQYPQIGIDGVKSLDTLISGPYVAAFPGDGAAKLEFLGDEARPPADANDGGLRVSLVATAVESVRRDSPVLFQGIEVGFVDAVSVEGSGGAIALTAVVHEEYAGLVRAQSYFREISGYEVNANLGSGIRFRSGSLRSIINGGIEFTNPSEEELSPPLTDQVFTLHSGESSSSGLGVPIEITFADAVGIVPGQTTLRHRGVTVGIVKDAQLTEGLQSVVVTAEIDRSYAELAAERSLFWIVRPQIDLTGVRGLDAFAGGVYISVRAGGGPAQSVFRGSEGRPNRPEFGPGLDLVLRSTESDNLSIGSPVFYKQVAVGKVTALDVGRSGDEVRIYINIEPRYAPLVRSDSRFWMVGGVRVKAGLADFEVEFETLESVVQGGLAFATPAQQEGSAPLTDGATFGIESEPNPEWSSWRPGIDLGDGY